MQKKILRNNKGFTLIEMAIVLVIIGLILGAVIKGKDVLNSAKQKKFYTSFLKQWELSVASYYDRTGNLLGDGSANGGTAATPNARMDNIWGNTFGNANGIDATIKAVGLTVPVSNTANSGQYTYTGTYSGTQTITIRFLYLTSATNGQNRNVLFLENVPTDLAVALDTMVDGQADATNGRLRKYDDNSAWPAADSTNVVRVSYDVDIL